jgi:Questin oxidase-like
MTRVLDDALERLRHTGPEAAEGAPNHGPMAAEALVALGYDDIVPQWVDAYRQQLGPMPETLLPVTMQPWRDALGSRRRVGDWGVFFRLQLSAAPWQAVLTAWLPRLIPGAMAHGTHGLIRTAHAVRAIEAAETPLRVEELAAALGYWAAYYQELPGVPHLTGTCAIDQALDQIPRLGRDYDRRVTPPEFVRGLDTHPDFPRAVDALTAPKTIAAALSTLTEVGARLYLTQASRYPLIFLHAVTGPVALRRLLPHLSTAMQHTAFAYVWQAVAAWTAAFSSPAPIAVWPDDVPSAAASEIVAQSVDTRDPHAIKFAEACLQEYRLNPRPVYLRAALDWPTRLRESLRRRSAGQAAAGIAVRWDPAAQPPSENCEQTGREGAP